MNATRSSAANGSDSGSERGTFVVIVGPDGVGKTTLARTILDRSQNGGFYFHFIPSPPTRLLDRPRNHQELVEKGNVEFQGLPGRTCKRILPRSSGGSADSTRATTFQV